MADDFYEVGFQKPPKHTQFQKGRSGNPQGRPKGSVNHVALIRKLLVERVTVKSPEGTRSISKLEAVLLQMLNKVINGDLRFMKEIIHLSKEVQEREPSPDTAPIFQVHFIDPVTKKPVIAEDLEKW